MNKNVTGKPLQLLHVAIKNQQIKANSALFVNDEILLTIAVLPQKKIKVFDGKTIRIIDYSDSIVVGRLVVMQEITMRGRSMDIPKVIRTDLHFEDYFSFLALAANKLPIIGNDIKLNTALHIKDVVTLDIKILVKHFPDKTGGELENAIGLVVGENRETKEFDVMIFNKTISLNRDKIISTNNRNFKYIYCLNNDSKQVGLEVYTSALEESNSVKPKTKAKAKTKNKEEEQE